MLKGTESIAVLLLRSPVAPPGDSREKFVYGFESFLVTQIPSSLSGVYRRGYQTAPHSHRSDGVLHDTLVSSRRGLSYHGLAEIDQPVQNILSGMGIEVTLSQVSLLHVPLMCCMCKRPRARALARLPFMYRPPNVLLRRPRI